MSKTQNSSATLGKSHLVPGHSLLDASASTERSKATPTGRAGAQWKPHVELHKQERMRISPDPPGPVGFRAQGQPKGPVGGLATLPTLLRETSAPLKGTPLWRPCGGRSLQCRGCKGHLNDQLLTDTSCSVGGLPQQPHGHLSVQEVHLLPMSGECEIQLVKANRKKGRFLLSSPRISSTIFQHTAMVVFAMCGWKFD